MTHPAAPLSYAAMALLLATMSAQANACGGPLVGEGRVAAVIDARTLRLDDGREVRLKGLAPLPDDHASRATAALKTFVGRTVTLYGDNDAPDRYGRQSLLVQQDATTPPIQIDLLAQGVALSDLTLSACAAAFRAAEATARRDRSGVWRDATVIKNAESPGELLAWAGRFAIVEGRVVSVRQAGSVTYVNFGRRWTRDFAVTMPARVLPSFATAGMLPKTFEGKRLRIRGFIERRGGSSETSPRIEAIRPEQIEIVGRDD